MSYTVAQNTYFLTLASIAQKAVSFVYFTVIARLIGVENTGVYFFAIAFTTIFTVVADFGLGPVLTREAARYPDRAERYLNTVFTIKLFFGLGAYVAVVVLVNLLSYPDFTKTLIYLSGITMFFDNLHSAFYSFLRARKNLTFEATGIVGSQLITLIIGSLALYFKLPLYWLILAYTIPSGLNVIYSGLCAHFTYKLSYRLILDRPIVKLFLALAVPFALAGIVSRFYAYSDSLLMSKLLTEKELGYWSVPYKITFAFQFIPSALVAGVYPAMSELFVKDPKRLAELFLRSWRYLLTIILPLSFGLVAVASPVIIKLYRPDYLPSVPVLRTLMISLIFTFLSMLIGATLNATNQQKRQTGLLTMALVINLIMNIFLLPRYGIMGAAVAAVVSNIILCSVGLYLVIKYLSLPLGRLARSAWSVLYPAVLMAVAVYYLLDLLGVYLAIPFGFLLYTGLLFLNGNLNKDILGMLRLKTKVVN